MRRIPTYQLVRAASFSALFSISLAATPAQAVDAGPQPARESYVQLAHPALGCPTLDLAAKVGEAIVLRDGPTLDELMHKGGCRPFRALQGVVSRTAEDSVCLLAIGASRCFWFASENLVPALER
jgi:hypothetical protein